MSGGLVDLTGTLGVKQYTQVFITAFFSYQNFCPWLQILKELLENDFQKHTDLLSCQWRFGKLWTEQILRHLHF